VVQEQTVVIFDTLDGTQYDSQNIQENEGQNRDVENFAGGITRLGDLNDFPRAGSQGQWAPPLRYPE